MNILKKKYNFFKDRKMKKAGISYSYAQPEHCRTLAKLYSIGTDGVADYYWSTVQRPGESLIDTGERLFYEDETFNYKNCIVACNEGGVIGMILFFHLDVDNLPPLDPATIDPVLLPYKKLESIDSFYCAALAVFPEYSKLRVGIHLMTLYYEIALGLGFKKMTHMVFSGKGQSVMNFWMKHMGYKLIATETVVENPYIQFSGEVILFAKDINSDDNLESSAVNSSA